MGNLISPIGNSVETATRPVGEKRPATESKPEREAVAQSASPEEVRSSLRENGDRVTFGNREIEFSYDDDLHRVIVKIFSSESDPPKVVRQIPAEEYLTFASRFRELVGILFDEQA